MDNKQFSKFFVASLKRTAQNAAPILKRIEKLQKEYATISEEIEHLNSLLNDYDAPIKSATGGYGVSDLVKRVVEVAGTNSEGKEIKVSKWVLKYPDTVIPPAESDSVPPAENNPVNDDITYNTASDVGESSNVEEEPSFENNEDYTNVTID